MNNSFELQKSSQAEGQPALLQQEPRTVFAPFTDIIESNDHYTLRVDMPGAGENDVDVTLENDILTIRGQVHPDSYPNGRLVHRGYEIGDYRRVFTLSAEVDREKIEAKVKDGVLELTLPKAEAAKARKIAVKAA